MKIALIGYGRMGHLIEQVARARGHQIVCVIDIDNRRDFDCPAFMTADVAIEFTSPAAAYDNYLRAWSHNVKVVSGSTGWRDDHLKDVERLCTEGGQTLFWASNFSVGMAIFSAVNRQLATIMNAYEQYDVSIREVHHVHKLDAPSGTAVTLADELVMMLDRKKRWVKGEQRLSDGSTVGSNNVQDDEIAIESDRTDEVPGIHSVCYDSSADKITITHEAHSREGFALGAVLAAEYTNTHHGLLTMSDLFSF